MKKFRRIMVGLDGKSSDTFILQHISKIKESFDLQKIYFVHITESLALPDDSELRYAQHLAPLDESIKKVLKSEIDSILKPEEGLSYEVIVKEGNPAEQLVKLIKVKQIDLLVLGRKPKPGITYFSRLLANQAPCSVIFVPKTLSAEYRKILVPLDFNSVSKQALADAFAYKDDHSKTEIIPVHFSGVPTGYTKTGKTYSEYTAQLRKKVKKRFRQLMPSSQVKDVTLILDKKENVAKKIFNYSLRKGADMIMIGSKGRTKIASFLMNSVAAKLVELTYHVPILIDKRKGQSLNTVNALMQL